MRSRLIELKPQYLKLIDLLRTARIEGFGKVGETLIAKAETEEIAALSKLPAMFDQLIKDGVVASCELKDDVFVIECLKTAEEILDYKRSLIIEEALGIQVEHVNGNYYIMYRSGHNKQVRLSDSEGALIHHLIAYANKPQDRDEIAQIFEITPAQVSSRLNAIRRKLVQLGFEKDYVDRVLPTYRRGEVVFNYA